MKGLLRRIRGAVGMGLTWAAGWSPIGAVIGLIMGIALGGVPLGVIITRWVGTFAVLGFLGGASFSTVLRLAEGRRRFDQLSLPRFAGWGAVGGILLGALAVTGGLLGPGLSFVDAIIMGAATLLGSGSAAASLALARRTADGPLLEGGTEPGELEPADRRQIGG